MVTNHLCILCALKAKKKKTLAKLNDLLEESGRLNLPLEARNLALSSKECYFFSLPPSAFFFTRKGLSVARDFQTQGTFRRKGLPLAERERERQ